MGGGSTTKSILTTVAVDILPIMINEVQNLITSIDPAGKRYNYLDGDQEYQQLVDDLKKVLEYQFMTDNGYPYNGANTLPKYVVEGARVTPHAEFVNTSTKTSDPITNYVTNTIVDKNVPEFCRPQFINDLIAFLETFLADEESSYQSQVFTASYTDPTTGKCHSVDAVMCFAVKEIDRGSGSEPYLFLSYIGVHYASIPQPAILLAPHPIPPTLPVVRIAFAASTVLVGAAVAAYIWRLPPNGINVLITGPAGLAFKITVAKKKQHRHDGSIDTTWVEKALKKAGIDKWEKKEDVATANEAQQFEILSRLEN